MYFRPLNTCTQSKVFCEITHVVIPENINVKTAYVLKVPSKHNALKSALREYKEN